MKKYFSFINQLFLTLILIYFILINKSSNRYELSIYEEYPIYFWIIIIFYIFLQYIFIQKNKNIIYYYNIIIIIVLILFIPFFRNYYFFGGNDPITHMGFIKDILNDNFINESNFYPVLHVLSTILYYILCFDLNTIIIIIPGLFTIVYIISTIILCKKYFNNKMNHYMILLFLLPYGNTNHIFAPSSLSFFMIPILLYLIIYLNYNMYKSKVLSFIFIMFIVFSHPVTSIFLLLILIILYFIVNLYNISILKNKLKNIIIFLFIAFSIKYLYTYIIIGKIYSIYKWFSVREGDTLIQNYSNVINNFSPKLIDIIIKFIINYGILFILSIIVFYIIYKMGKYEIYSYSTCIDSMHSFFFEFLTNGYGYSYV